MLMDAKTSKINSFAILSGLTQFWSQGAWTKIIACCWTMTQNQQINLILRKTSLELLYSHNRKKHELENISPCSVR